MRCWRLVKGVVEILKFVKKVIQNKVIRVRFPGGVLREKKLERENIGVLWRET